jgi:hypothetical protein
MVVNGKWMQVEYGYKQKSHDGVVGQYLMEKRNN